MASIRKETLTYFIGTLLLAILNFIISIMYGDMFSPDDYGGYSLVFAMYSLLSQIAVGWVTASLVRYYASHKNEKKDHKLIGSIFIQHIFFSIIELIGVFTTINLFPASPEIKNLILTFSIFFVFESYILFINTIMRVTNNAKQYNINTNLNSLLKIGVLLFLYYVVGLKSTLAIAISLVASEVIQSFYLTKKYGFLKYFSLKNYDREVILRLLKYGIPLVGVSMTNWILSVSDRYIIRYFYSDYEVGLYSYSYNIANSVVSLLSQFIMLGAYPNIVRKWEEDGSASAIDMIKQYLSIYLLLIVPVCFGFLCTGKQFFTIFTNERYWGGYINFIVTGFGIAILGLTAYTNKVWELKKKTLITLLLSITAAIVNVCLNICLIPIMGYTAGSVTTAVAYLVYLLLSIILSRKYMRLQADWRRILKISFATLIMSAVITILNVVPVLDSVAGFLLKVAVGAIIYVTICTVTKAIDSTTTKRLFEKTKIR